MELRVGVGHFIGVGWRARVACFGGFSLRCIQRCRIRRFGGLRVIRSIAGVGQLLLAVARPLWLRGAIALAFVAPAAIAGYHATHGIVKHAMPSETWQIAFSVVGAIAVGVTAFLRISAMAAPEPSGQGMARG